MKKDFIGRIILSLLLIIFMYAAAACSVNNDESDDINDVDSWETNAKKSAFTDEASSFVKAAEEKAITDGLTDGSNVSSDCYTLDELIGDYVTVSGKYSYEGVVVKKDNKWSIYITNGELLIDGKTIPVDVKDVKEGSKLSKKSC